MGSSLEAAGMGLEAAGMGLEAAVMGLEAAGMGLKAPGGCNANCAWDSMHSYHVHRVSCLT